MKHITQVKYKVDIDTVQDIELKALALYFSTNPDELPKLKEEDIYTYNNLMDIIEVKNLTVY